MLKKVNRAFIFDQFFSHRNQVAISLLSIKLFGTEFAIIGLFENLLLR